MASSGGYAISITATDSATKVIDGVNKRLASLSAPAERFNKSLSKFGEVSGLSRVTEGIRDLGRSSLDAFRSLDRMAGPLAAMTGAASIAGVIELSRKWGEYGNRLQQLGYRLDTPIDRLTALERGARLAGSSGDALDRGLTTLSDHLHGAAFGRDTPAIQLLNSLKVGFGDAEHGARNAQDAMGDIADAIKRLPDPATQARVVRELFGGEELLPFLKRGREGIAEYTEEAKRLGGVVTPEMAERATKLWHSVGQLETAAGGVANAISDKLAPSVTNLNERLADWAARNKDVIASGLLEWLNKISGWFDRHPQLAGFIIGAVAGAKVGGAPGAVVGGVLGSMPGGPFQPAQMPDNQPDPDQRPFSWWNPGTWLHHAPGTGPMGGGGAGGAPPTAGTPAAGVAQRTHDFWRSKGYTEPQVAGILAGGPGAESGFDPTRIGDNGTSFGLYQHHADRWAAMQRRYGTQFPNEQQQNEYAAWEMSPEGPEHEAGDAVRRSTTSEQSAMAFTGGFERPADPGEPMRRGRQAGRYVGLYDAGPDAAPGGAPGAPGASGHVQVDVHLKNAPPGTTAKVTTNGPVTAPPPRVETSFPGVM